MLNKDLDKLIDEFMDANNNEVSINETASYFYGLGKQAMKEQMMENAVEGEVVKDISNKLAVTAKGIDLDGFKFGDKVRVIIVKDEEK